MSDHTTELPPYAEPEPEPEPERTRGSRSVVAVVASVVAVVLIAGGGYAAWQFFAGGGPRPAEVLPDSTFALVTVDLNPSGGQKVEAIRTLRKFPSWNKRTGVKPDSDVVKAIFDKALEDGPCKSLDYERDVKPWIGSRAAFGGVLVGGKAAPVIALQVSDAANAKPGFAKLVKCSGADDDEEFGWTVTDDYVIASDSTDHAKAIVTAGEKAPLAEDADFQKWTDKVGGPGIMNAYLGRTSVKILSDTFESDLGDLTGSDKTAEDELNKALKDFKGAAAGLKFADGGIELSFAGGGAARAGGKTVGAHVGALPEDTAAVLAVAVPEKALESLKSGGSQQDSLSWLGEFFTPGTGLELPDDLITLLGSSLSFSVGGDAPADIKDVDGLGDVPLGLLVHGDDAKIKAVIAKVEANTGARLSDLPATVSSKDGRVAIATTPGYADDLLADGSLAGVEGYKDVVSHPDDAQAVFYVSFQNKWMDALRDLTAEEHDKDLDEVADNVAALKAFGASFWRDGDTAHGLVRIALK
jgi:hypothetical protein